MRGLEHGNPGARSMRTYLLAGIATLALSLIAADSAWG